MLLNGAVSLSLVYLEQKWIGMWLDCSPRDAVVNGEGSKEWWHGETELWGKKAGEGSKVNTKGIDVGTRIFLRRSGERHPRCDID